ncbi:hypothetical protein KFK09_011805 [Dendrobium nobile]|uniref:Beta-glucosidase-like SFR2, chloroplastic n=1 Tax=Dendrobium nobile TaxID=94219 RepID=A0A8T3BFX6_DENNO|nr:hypothetical protein KFK09_011805 [Dendrobium nobile]
MGTMVLIVGAMKLAGIVVTLSVAANVFSFSRYRRKFLRPFRSPIDESADVLAAFNVNSTSEENGFFFGLATAPAHVEDKLDDAWLQFAEEQPCGESNQSQKVQSTDAVFASAAADGGSQQASSDGHSSKESIKGKIKRPLKIAMEAMIRGFEKFSDEAEPDSKTDCTHNVAAWHNVPHPQKRLRFWSDPDTELKLAKDTGITVFRLGIDWSRIMPKEPENVLNESVSYQLIVGRVSDLVDYWVTFNEPHVFCMLTYCAGAWPGGNPDMIEVATSTLPSGVFSQALHCMAVAHSLAYDYILKESKNGGKTMVGIAHHVSFTRPYGLFDVAAVTLANSLTLFPYVDTICDKLDFLGINYYGQEVITGPGLKLVDNEEYSESGRAVYPDGLFRVLHMFHDRYKHMNVPFIITENGISDKTDLIRRPYLLEHLLAVYAAMITGVPVLGYLFWTTSDNWEWADGYGPKFGLLAVDRANDLARIPRPSYHLFSKVVKTGRVTKLDRDHAWGELQRAAREKKTHPFYRAVDKNGCMYAGGLDEPIYRPYIARDWRFGHYEMDGLQDPVSRLWRSITAPITKKKKKASVFEEDDLEYQDCNKLSYFIT